MNQFSTVSDNLVEIIKNHKVKKAIFTTYNFQPEFFDLEILPLLLPDMTYPNDYRIKKLIIREHFDRNKIPIEIYYDGNIFDYSSSPAMEYFHIPVKHTGAFHAKLIFMILSSNNKEEGGDNNIYDESDSLLVYSGSHNLTKSGWWSNIENFNYQIFNENNKPSKIIKQNIISSLDYLNKQNIYDDTNSTKEFIGFLNKIGTSNSNNNFNFYFSSNDSSKHKNFFEFLKENIKNPTDINTIEILSPFFPTEKKDDLIINLNKHFTNAKFKIYMPRDPDGLLLCPKEFYKLVKSKQSYTWSDLNDEMIENLNSNTKDQHRKFHAKIFHLISDEYEYYFTGSVNFTNAAFYRNIEAGFLYQNDILKNPTGLLEREDYDKSNFNENIKNCPGDESKKYSELNLYIIYNWNEDNLSIKIKSLHKDFNIKSLLKNKNAKILNDSNDILLKFKLSKMKLDQDAIYINIQDGLEKLKDHLAKKSLVNIKLPLTGALDNIKSEFQVLVQELDWDCKPNTDISLNWKEIINIYIRYRDNKEKVYGSHKVKELKEHNALGSLSFSLIKAESVDSFFSAYAEIFYGFRKLKDELKNEDKRKYYLIGKRPDSFINLIESVNVIDESSSSVKNLILQYLILLSVYEIIQKYKNDKILKKKFEHKNKMIQTINYKKRKIKKQLIAKRSKKNNLDKFLSWYEKHFLNKKD